MIDIDPERFRTLLHAYGWASDTPGHLRALAEGQPAEREAALAHLWSAVIHQGTPWTVTPSASLVVAGLLGDARLAGPEWAQLRAALLDFLASVAEAGSAGRDPGLVALADPADRDVDAELRALHTVGTADHSAAGDGDDVEGGDADSGAPDGVEGDGSDSGVSDAEEDDGDDDDDEEDDEDDGLEALWQDEVLAEALFARAVLGCWAAIPELFAAARRLLGDPDPAVRAAAARAVSVCYRSHAAVPPVAEPASSLGRPVAALAEPVPALAEPARLAEEFALLAATAEPDERAALVLAMGELGLAPRDHLTDPHPGVRACAALAPALADDPAATDELLAALDDPGAVDGWFRRRPPQWQVRPRFVLVGAVVERVRDFNRLLPVALAIADTATLRTVDRDWGRLLVAAFPDGPAETGVLTEAQRRYLAALVDDPELWNPVYGNAALAFKQAGLPYDRERCRALLGGGRS